MTAEKLTFKLGKNPLVKDKIIVLEEADGSKAVIFPQYRQKEEIEHAEIAKAGETLDLTGKWGTDKKTGKPQFFVDTAYNAAYQKEVNSRPPVDVSGPKKEEVSIEQIMSMPAKDLIPLSQRKMDVSKYTFPDGNFFYSDGLEVWIEKDGPRKKLTRSFLDLYNSKHTLMDWFLPDWYSAGLDTPDAELLDQKPLRKALRDVRSDSGVHNQ